MYPTNQIILNGDSMFSQIDDLDAQIQKMEAYRQKLKNIKEQQSNQPKLIWDDIDAELNTMTDSQKEKLFSDEQYVETYNSIQSIVNSEILNLVKAKIESTTIGKELLTKQYQLVKKLKGKIVEETNREIELFRMFKEYSTNHPEATYEEFIKSYLK